MSIAVIFLVVALILFLVSTFNVPTPVNLVAAGLACVTVAMLLGAHVL